MRHLGKVAGSKKLDNGRISITFEVAGKGSVTRVFRAVRGGLSWPSVDGEIPGYYVILGEPFDPHESYGGDGPRVLRFLREREVSALDFNRLCESVTEDAVLYSCDTFYMDREGAENEEFYLGLLEYQDGLGIRTPDFIQAPFSDNFAYGISLVKDKLDRRLFMIPRETILHEQLSSISKLDLKQNPETHFFAVNALRYLLGGLTKYRPQPRIIVSPRPMAPITPQTSGGWMVS